MTNFFDKRGTVKRGIFSTLIIGTYLISGSIFFYTLYTALEKFRSVDPKPPIEYLTPKRISALSSDMETVTVSLYVNDFPEFNIIHNAFVLDGTVSFQFDPSLVSITTLDSFSFEKGEILFKSAPTTRLIDNKVLVYYDIRVKFTNNMNYKLFPIDDHQIFITLENKDLSPNAVILTSSNADLVVSDGIYTGGWIFEGHSVQYGYVETSLERDDPAKTITYPRVIFTLDFVRAGMRSVIIILIPLLVLFLLAGLLLIFIQDFEIQGRLGISGAVIGALLTYRFVIETMSPRVGYFMIADYFFLFVLAFATFTFSVLVLARNLARGYSTLMIAVANLLMIILWVYLIVALPHTLGV